MPKKASITRLCPLLIRDRGPLAAGISLQKHSFQSQFQGLLIGLVERQHRHL